LVPVVLIKPCTADDRSNARGAGMSFATMVSSYGINAYGINPANFVTLKDIRPPHDFQKVSFLQKNWQFSIMSVGGGYGSDSSLDFYHNYLKYLTINRATFTDLFSDLESVLDFRRNVLPNEKTDVNYDFELKWFSLNFYNPKLFAANFTISDKVGLNTDVLGRDEYMPLNFMVTFNQNGSYNLTNVNLNQSEATAWWIRKYNVGIAKQFTGSGFLKNIQVGISAGLVHGFGTIITYKSSINMNTYGIQQQNNVTHVDSVTGKQRFDFRSSLTDFFRDYSDGAKSHFEFFPKPAGKGYSFDIGINLQLGSHIQIGASITEIGKITWDYNTVISYDTNSFVYRNFNLDPSDPTYNAFVNDLDGFDTRDTGTSFQTNMPTKYRAGILYRVNNNLMFEVDWVKGDNNLPSNSTRQIFSLGGEYYPVKYVPLRGGVSIGGPEGFSAALGTGLRLNNFELDFAANGINHILKNSRLAASISGKVLF